MSRAWLINSRAIAKKVRNPSFSAAYQVKDLDATRECPSCHYLIRNTEDSPEWAGLPGGVKFDPSDVELLDHLAAKCGVEDSKPDMCIDEFIPTLDTDQGICYTHPENLPGIRKDGISAHYFHKTSNAYAIGQRKRRKIQRHHGFVEDVRWHKTGKTKAVMDNGVQKGFKKIMVLYKSSKKGLKPNKANWVMHQYHLGTEDEKEGEFVVSKVFYQHQKLCGEIDKNNVKIENLDVKKTGTSPRTPKANPPPPPRPVKCEFREGKSVLQSFLQEEDFASELYQPGSSSFLFEDIASFPAWFAGESQAVENCDLNSLGCDNLLCKETFDCHTLVNDSGLDRNNQNTNKAVDLDSMIDWDTSPDFQLDDLQFGSQDSWLVGQDAMSRSLTRHILSHAENSFSN